MFPNSYAGKWGGYYGRYLQRSRAMTNTEANTNKAVSGLVYVRPAPMVPFLKGFNWPIMEIMEKAIPTSPLAGRTNDYPGLAGQFGHISLQHEYVYRHGPILLGSRQPKPRPKRITAVAICVEGFVRIPGCRKTPSLREVV